MAQVSITSGSPTKPFGWPRCPSPYPGGASLCGSVGRASSAQKIGLSQTGSPALSVGYQTGNGTPK